MKRTETKLAIRARLALAALSLLGIAGSGLINASPVAAQSILSKRASKLPSFTEDQERVANAAYDEFSQSQPPGKIAVSEETTPKGNRFFALPTFYDRNPLSSDRQFNPDQIATTQLVSATDDYTQGDRRDSGWGQRDSAGAYFPAAGLDANQHSASTPASFSKRNASFSQRNTSFSQRNARQPSLAQQPLYNARVGETENVHRSASYDHDQRNDFHRLPPPPSDETPVDSHGFKRSDANRRGGQSRNETRETHSRIRQVSSQEFSDHAFRPQANGNDQVPTHAMYSQPRNYHYPPSVPADHQRNYKSVPPSASGASSGYGIRRRRNATGGLPPNDNPYDNPYEDSYRESFYASGSGHQANPGMMFFKCDQCRQSMDHCGCDCGNFSRNENNRRKGLYFASYQLLVGMPYYSDNHLALIDTATSGLTVVQPFEYDATFASRLNFGYESEKGPGGQAEYFRMDSTSNPESLARPLGLNSVSGILNVPQIPIGTYSISPAVGGRLDAVATQRVESYQAEFFKRIYWPVSTLSGGLGLNYTILNQGVDYFSFPAATSTSASNQLLGRRRFEGVGPTFGMDYHRPIGHTHLSAIGGLQAGLLFGSDEWIVQQDAARLYQANANRVITTLGVQIGIEWTKALRENSGSRIFVRTTLEGQNWLNAGSFSSESSDFGFASGNFAVGVSY